jgi:8-oxo-dGTP pyrophosphatase MutT (NUDIX family)
VKHFAVKLQHDGLEPAVQYAALPWRKKNGLEVMLITSRGTRRWVIPKGWPMKGRKPYATAAIEAIEEAGLLGRIEKQAVGAFRYLKKLADGQLLTCDVEVFPLRVTHQLETWPEKHQRTTKWFPFREAARLVSDPDLGEIIRGFGMVAGRNVKTAAE